MFDLGWSELLLIGVVALIVVGPKDLPVLFRNVGRFVGKAKGMAREFSRAMEQAADEAGVKDAADTVRKATSARNLGLDSVKDAAKDFAKWTPDDSLSDDRKDVAKKIHDATAKAATKRQEQERAAAEAARAEAAADAEEHGDLAAAPEKVAKDGSTS